MATVVFFHAHPDDEAWLTGGTIAGLAAEGHRVVIVVACDGEVDPSTGPDAGRRRRELDASAAVLGAARVVHLGYADSGHGPVLYDDPPDRQRFVRADIDEAAARLATVLRQERADGLVAYDARGGYGHRDHRRVHEVGRRAAALTGSMRLLEATVPRGLVVAGLTVGRAARLLVGYDGQEVGAGFTPRGDVTHAVDVRPWAAAKQRSVAAHRSQWEGTGRAAGLARLAVRLPTPVFGLVFGREWFVEVGAGPVGSRRGRPARHLLAPAGASGRTGAPSGMLLVGHGTAGRVTMAPASMREGTSGEARVTVAATPEAVYDVVSDVTRIPQWSPECVRAGWVGGATAASPGARFRATNRVGVVRWTNTPRVVTAERGRAFAFVAPDPFGRDTTRWSYRFEPAGSGVEVTESFELVRDLPLYIRLFERVALRSKDRQADLQANVRSSLDRLKAVVEGGPA